MPVRQVHLRLVGPAIGPDLSGAPGAGVVRVDEQLDACEGGGSSVRLVVECVRGLFPAPAPGPEPIDCSNAGHAATSTLLRDDRQGCASDGERRPHLVLAFNAGLCAYESWLEALQYCYVSISFTSNIIVVVYSVLLTISYC